MRRIIGKKMIVGVILIITIFNFEGCKSLHLFGHVSAQADELMLGCITKYVDNSLGAHNYVCENGEKIFYCDQESIYMNDIDFEDLSTSQEIVSGLQYNPEYMCCTSDKLFYSTADAGVHVVNLDDFSEKVYFKDYEADSIFKKNEDVYVSFSDQLEVFCFSGDTAPVSVEPDYDSIEYAPIIDGSICFQVNGRAFTTDSRTYCFDSEQVNEWKELFEIDESPVVQSSEIVKDEKGAYFLFKYARIHAGEPNPRNGDLLRTAIFYFDGETEKTKLVYANNKGEQIGSYSVSKQEIYILRNDGIYSIDFTGKNEKKLYDLQVDEDNFAGENNFSNNKIKNGTEIMFEECNGKLFVYYEELLCPHLITVL